MSTRADERLWERVHAALDARRDPLSDPEVRLAARQDSAFARSVELLCARLDRLVPARRPRRRRAAALAGLALLIGAAAWGLTTGRAPAPPPSAGGKAAATPDVSPAAIAAVAARPRPDAPAVRSFRGRSESFTPGQRALVERDGAGSVTSIVASPEGSPCLWIASVTQLLP